MIRWWKSSTASRLQSAKPVLQYIMNPTDPAFIPPFNYWSRYYGTFDGDLCSWSFSPWGIKSPLTCEAPYVPRGEMIIVPTYDPPSQFNPPVIVVDSTPGNVPVTVTPEPAAWMMMAMGVMVIMLVRKLVK